MQIKILSWNIWINSHFEQVKDFFSKTDAQIIGLQEVNENDNKRPVIKYLDSLGFKHVFAPVPKKWRGKTLIDGPAVFTKFDIATSKIYSLSEKDSRAAVQTDLKIGKTILHVFSTHLLHTHQQESPVQEDQIDYLLKQIPSKKSILMGDFNATPQSKIIKKAEKVLICADPSNQPTWSNYPEGCQACNPRGIFTRLDYIFTTKDVKTSSYKVESSKGSDHLPISVIAEI